MKYFLAILLALTSSFTSAQGYEINVKLKGGPEEKPLTLAHYLGANQYVKVDSAKLENGSYKFKGEEPLKGGIYLLVIDPTKFYDILISGHEHKIAISADTIDFLKTVKFEGSKENTTLYAYRKFITQKTEEAEEINRRIEGQDEKTEKARFEAFGKLQKEVEEYMEATIKKSKDGFASKIIAANREIKVPEEIPRRADGTPDSTFGLRYYKAHFWDNIDFSDDRMLRTPFIQTKLERYFKSLVYQIEDSVIHDADIVLKLSKQNKETYRYVLWWITNKYENIDIVGLDSVFVHLVENYYLKDADWINEDQRKKFEERLRIIKPVLTGSVFPELMAYDTLGQAISPNLSNTPFTIVYFYSPDCGHCKEAAPKLIEFAKTAKQKGITLYNVSVDHEEAKWLNFIRTYKTDENMYNLWDKGMHYDFRESFDVSTTPTSYILNAEKKIIAKRISVEEFDRFIEFYKEKTMKTQSN